MSCFDGCPRRKNAMVITTMKSTLVKLNEKMGANERLFSQHPSSPGSVFNARRALDSSDTEVDLWR